MQRIAIGWLTWELTHSGTWLGLIAVADLCPSIVIAPFAGVVADRLDRLRLAKLTQLAALLQAICLAVLAFSDLLTINLLFSLTLLQGIIFAFWQPVRLALLPSLVARQDLASAVAINSVVFNTARFIGPALGGVIIVWLETGWLFTFNALSFLLFLFALNAMQLPKIKADLPRQNQNRFLVDILDGYRFAAGHHGIAPLLLLLIASCLLLRPVFELLPGFADQVFERGAGGLSALVAVTGIGAVGGGFWLGQRGSVKGLSKIVISSMMLFAITLLLFSMTRYFVVGLLSLAVAGLLSTLAGAGVQTLLQTAVPMTMRGRVMSLYGMIIRAGPALGALAMGSVSELIGLQWPVIIASGLAFWLAYWALSHLPVIQQALERDTIE